MIQIWDNHNKQWLEPMSIIFGSNGDIEKVTACVKDADPLVDGWYDIRGKELDKIAIKGKISFNENLIP